MLACHSVKIWLMLGEEKAGNTWKTILIAQLPRYKSQQSISEHELDQKMFDVPEKGGVSFSNASGEASGTREVARPIVG